MTRCDLNMDLILSYLQFSVTSVYGRTISEVLPPGKWQGGNCQGGGRTWQPGKAYPAVIWDGGKVKARSGVGE